MVLAQIVLSHVLIMEIELVVTEIALPISILVELVVSSHNIVANRPVYILNLHLVVLPTQFQVM